jgi:hypothetical protein
MDLPNPVEYVPHIDAYVLWAFAWYEGFIRENAIFVQLLTLLTGWTIPTPATILAWFKKGEKP